jgi:3-oxoacyl-[acyl-carrier-protein] synthase II
MSTHSSAPQIVGWSVLSPLGTGRRAFADGLRGGRPRRRLPDLDLAALVGDKSTRVLDRMTLMVIATTGMVLREHSDRLGDALGSVGLVLGTNTGSVASTTAFVQDTFTQERPYFVNPTLFPNTVMNGAAGHTAIWHGLTGLNSTVSSGHLTGFAALRYAYRMVRSGYAETLLVGCVEELSAPVAAASGRLRRVDGRPGGRAPGEGCAVFLVSAAGSRLTGDGRPALAEMVDFEFRLTPRDPGVQGQQPAQADQLAAAIRDLLRRNGVTAEDLWSVGLGHGGTDDLGRAERSAVDRALQPQPAPSGPTGDANGGPPRFAVAERIGDCYSASGAFQLAALLVRAETATAPAGRLGMLTSLGADGAVAAALVRTRPAAGSPR